MSTSSSLSISGLSYLQGFLTADDEAAVMRFAAEQTHWHSFGSVKRRLSFGFVYGISSRRIIRVAPAVPPLLTSIAARLVDLQLIESMPEQVVIQDYVRPGIGIGAHVDARVFGPTVCTVSMLSPCVMRFRGVATRAVVDHVLEARSVLSMRQEARTDWTHEILGRSVVGRRLSITFRTLAEYSGEADHDSEIKPISIPG